MKFVGSFALFLLAALAAPASAADRTPPPVRVATSFAAVDIHDDERVAIAADPYESKGKAKLFRVDFLKHGFLPVRLVVTNNSDRPISLGDARILFETAGGERIQAADPEDVQRRMAPKFEMNNGTPIPKVPVPIPSIGGAGKPKGDNKKIQEEFDAFEFVALAVEAHTTRAGFLFYDVSGLDNPLKGAKLILRKVRNADGKELFLFEIPFDLYLRSKTAHME